MEETGQEERAAGLFDGPEMIDNKFASFSSLGLRLFAMRSRREAGGPIQFVGARIKNKKSLSARQEPEELACCWQASDARPPEGASKQMGQIDCVLIGVERREEAPVAGRRLGFRPWELTS